MKKVFLFLTLLLFTFVGAMKADNVVVGLGMHYDEEQQAWVQNDSLWVSSYVPTYTYYNYSVSQQIYTAQEIGMAGKILDFTIRRYQGTANRSIKIYMKTVSESDMTAGYNQTVTEDDLVDAGVSAEEAKAILEEAQKFLKK